MEVRGTIPAAAGSSRMQGSQGREIGLPGPDQVRQSVLTNARICTRPGLDLGVAVKRWPDFAPPFVLGAFMAVQSYAAFRTWRIANSNTIAIGAP
jgi:hypothetical protein